MNKQTKNSLNSSIDSYTIVKTKAIKEIISLLSRVNSDFVYIAQDNLIDIKNNEDIK